MEKKKLTCTFLILFIFLFSVYCYYNNYSIQFAYGESMNKGEMHLFNCEKLPVIPTLPPFNIHLINYNIDNLQVGDVIMFLSEYRDSAGNRIIVTHRIIEIHGDLIITKGDNNLSIDPQVKEIDVIARVVCFPKGIIEVGGIEIPALRIEVLAFVLLILLLYNPINKRVHEKIY